MQSTLEQISRSDIALLSAAMLGWVAVVYLMMAFGLRSGDLVWTGYWPGRLPANMRVRSFLYGFGLLLSGWFLLEITGVIDPGIIPDRFMLSAGFVVTAFLGISGVASLVKGSRWERMFFVPITLLGAGLAGWFTFFV